MIIVSVVGAVVFVGLSICLFVLVHNCTLVEMASQISKNGFYKKDIITLQDNYILQCWLLIGAIVMLIIGCVFICVAVAKLLD